MEDKNVLGKEYWAIRDKHTGRVTVESLAPTKKGAETKFIKLMNDLFKVKNILTMADYKNMGYYPDKVYVTNPENN